MRIHLRRDDWKLAGLCIAVFAQTTVGSVQNDIRALMSKPEHKKTLFSVYFCDLESGKEVFSVHPDRVLAPASNMKLITTAAAVDQLGADFNFETMIGLSGEDLVIFAGGDPLTGDPVVAQQQEQDIYYLFSKVYDSLAGQSVSCIKGDLLIDATLFDDERFHPSWPADQGSNWYAAQISALNYNNNCVDLHVCPNGQAGSPVQCTLEPDTKYVQIDNRCETASKGKNAPWAVRDQDSNSITLRGTCTAAATINVTVDRPSAFFGFVLAEYLMKKGIHINGKLIVRRLRDDQGCIPDTVKVLYVHRTPLDLVLARCNQRSLNMAAECLFKTLGAYHSRSAGAACGQGSWATGRNAIGAFLKKIGISSEHYVIDDGCGLSHNNRLTARCITAVLRYMNTHPGREVFWESMATPENGTLRKRNRFAEAKYDDRLYAKTGYIAGTRCISGYCRQKGGRWLAFSILTNESIYKTTPLIDEIVKRMMAAE